ncbi:FecR domain-containing protein [Propionivibrio sp.]|uniref:FecR domain-containing protein n=1 Tax=Propionivibrio sp. TaxID=2212460 RepID=UPI003BF04BFD
MKKCFPRFLLAAGLLFCGISAPAVVAAERAYAVVDSVQMPAWVERHGVRQPLEPGKVLQNRDRVATGADARVLIQLAEGSAVKLGENAQLDLNALGRRENRVFTAALDVAQGAFRFTTGVFSTWRQQRAVNVRLGTITAGIRGTDLWGSSDAERDLVCLLEGRITVVHPQDEPREMSEALSFYVAPKGLVPNPLGQVDAEQVSKWATQTEVRPGSGYARRGGKWNVELATLDGESDTLALYYLARAAGYAVRIKPRAAAGGGYRYSVRVTQLPSPAEAAVLAEKLKLQLALTAPVVTR